MHLNIDQLLQMRQKPLILNCNNNINSIISPAAKVNADAIKHQIGDADAADIADTKWLGH